MRRALIAGLILAGVATVSAPALGLTAPTSTLDVLVTDSRGVALGDAEVSTSTESAKTDHWGRVRVEATPGEPITVSHPRFPTQTAVWDGADGRLVVPLGAEIVRAIHVSGTLPGTARWDELLALADSTSVNAFMLDLKDESGRVFAETGSATAHEVGAALGWWNLADIVSELHGRDLGVVVRIVTFQDPLAGIARPDMAVRTASGGPFTRRGQTFLDPSDPAAREYGLELAEEACAAGADEVQFDYVRYPDGDRSGLHFDTGHEESTRVATIESFLAEAKARVGDECRIAADIFGFVTSTPGDGGIGQHLETLAAVADVLSPMAYPNHWGPGWFGFAAPADHPGEVIDGSMRDAIGRAGGLTTVRPWLQDFGGYGPAEVRAQIFAADSLGLGWMIWNAGSSYTVGGIPTAGELSIPADLPDAFTQALPSSNYWDVPDSSTFALDVRWLGAEGITTGCNPPWHDDYCPTRSLTRAEAATMLVRALDLPPSAVDRFTDDESSSHEAAINALAAAGITRGCSLTTYCPYQPLTRAQMASLLARALDLEVSDADTFDDDDHSSHEPDIERIAAAGITRGCSSTAYCPESPVLRDQMAAFLHRALA